MEYIIITNFILINLSLIFSSIIIYSVLNKKINDLGHRILSSSLLYFSILTILLIMLGIIGKLTLFWISLSSYLIFIFSLFYYSKNKTSPPLTKQKNISKKTLFLFSLLSLPAIFFILNKLFIASFQVPLGVDAFNYHLPMVIEWIQTGSLNNIYYNAFAPPLAYYPSNFNLIYLFSTIGLNNDLMLNLLNFPILTLLIISIYFTSKAFGISKNVRIISVISFITIPIVIQQLGAIFVDLYFILCFTYTIYYLHRLFYKNFEIFDSIFFGLATGLFLGTKYLGLPYGIILITIFTTIFFTKYIKKYKTFFIGIITIFLTGSFFYIRNLIISGNPIFPIEVSLFNKTIFAGYEQFNNTNLNTALLDNISNWNTITSFFQSYWEMTGIYGLIILFFSIIACVFSLYKLITKKELKFSIILIFITTTYFLLYLKAPYSFRDLIHNIRYAFPFIILGLLALGIFISKHKKLLYIFFTISLISTYHNLYSINKNPENITHLDYWVIKEHSVLFIIFLSSILLLTLTLFFITKIKTRNILITCFIFLYIFILNQASIQRDKIAHDFYELWYPKGHPIHSIWTTALWLDKNTNATKVAYTGFNLHYPFFGRNLKRQVDYININNCNNCRHADYKSSKQSIRRDPDKLSWLKSINNMEKEYIIIYDKYFPDVKMWEKEWVLREKNKFELVFSYEEIVVYKINN